METLLKVLEIYNIALSRQSHLTSAYSSSPSLYNNSSPRLCTLRRRSDIVTQVTETVIERARTAARRAPLPTSEREVLAALSGDGLHARVRALYEAGWSLSSIGDAFSPPRARTTVRSWINACTAPAEELPLVPAPPPSLPASSQPVPSRARALAPGIPEHARQRIAALAPVARRFRARTNPNSPIGQAHAELTALCQELHSHGVPIRALALAAGVTYRAMALRVNSSK